MITTKMLYDMVRAALADAHINTSVYCAVTLFDIVHRPNPVEVYSISVDDVVVACTEESPDEAMASLRRYILNRIGGCNVATTDDNDDNSSFQTANAKGLAPGPCGQTE